MFFHFSPISQKLLLTLILGVISIAIVSCSDPETMNYVAKDTSAGNVTRGKYLFDVAACASCHGNGALLSGGPALAIGNDVEHAPMLAGNTLNKWSVDGLVRFFRTGEFGENLQVAAGVHDGYEWLSDEDLISLSAYLYSLPPLSGGVEPRRSESSYFSGTSSSDRSVHGFVPHTRESSPIAYGKYLADSVMRCTECHGGDSTFFKDVPYLGGGRVLHAGDRKVEIPALNVNGGFLHWPEQDIKIFLQTGIHIGGKKVDPELCPSEYFSRADDQDIAALVAFFSHLSDS